jgi:Zn-dependent protease
MRISGSLTVARPFGVPVRIHWSVLLFAFFAGQFSFAPGAWLAYLLLILIHEAGHAFVVRRVGARATALDVLGFGGLCWWEGEVTPLQRACIAWGGIWAQLVVLVVTAVCVGFLGHPASKFADDMVNVALWSNLWLIGMNLLPIPPLDGKEAWSLFPLLRRRLALRRELRRTSIAGAARSSASLDRTSSHSSLDRTSPAARGSASTGPRVAAPSARIRLIAPRLDPRQIRNPTAVEDDIDESSFTPEVEAVLERARAIARDAAREAKGTASPPPHAGDVPGAPPSGRKPRTSDAPPRRGGRDT